MSSWAAPATDRPLIRCIRGYRDERTLTQLSMPSCSMGDWTLPIFAEHPAATGDFKDPTYSQQIVKRRSDKTHLQPCSNLGSFPSSPGALVRELRSRIRPERQDRRSRPPDRLSIQSFHEPVTGWRLRKASGRGT